MTSAPDFFRYLSPAPRDECWGITVSAGGSYHSQSGGAYPPSGHPADHGFTWERGRVLGAYQILFLLSGSGRFESALTQPAGIREGQAVILFPDVWHRYRPEPGTAWHEQWLELRGPVLPQLEREEFITPRDPVFTPSGRSSIAALFHRILDSLRSGGTRPDPLAGSWALEMLAHLHADRIRLRPPKPIALVVAQAERMLTESLAAPPPLEDLARDLGVAYSYLRREFKASTGFPPGQYVRRLRLEKAMRMLGNTSDTVRMVAERLGFSSEFHFSTAFRKQFGLSPSKWRDKTRPGAGPAARLPGRAEGKGGPSGGKTP